MIYNKRNAASTCNVGAFETFDTLDSAEGAESHDDVDWNVDWNDRSLLQMVRMRLAGLMLCLLAYSLIQGVGMFNAYISHEGIVSSSTYSEQREVFIFVHTYAALVWCACMYECSFAMTLH